MLTHCDSYGAWRGREAQIFPLAPLCLATSQYLKLEISQKIDIFMFFPVPCLPKKQKKTKDPKVFMALATIHCLYAPVERSQNRISAIFDNRLKIFL